MHAYTLTYLVEHFNQWFLVRSIYSIVCYDVFGVHTAADDKNIKQKILCYIALLYMYVEMRDTVFGVHVVTERTVVELDVITVCF